MIDKLFLIFFLLALVKSEELNYNFPNEALRVGSTKLLNPSEADKLLSNNEFFIEQLNGKNFLESENTFFLLSVTGESPDTSSTGVNIDTSKPSLIGSFTFTTDKEIDQNVLLQDLSIITGVPQERFRIISIAYLQIEQAINSDASRSFSTLSFIKKILVQFEILPVTDDSGLTPEEIFQKLKTSSGISTTYLSDIASDTFLEKCSDDQFKTDCTPSKDTNYMLIIPTTISGLIILLTTVLCIYKHKKKPTKNVVFKIERKNEPDIVQSAGDISNISGSGGLNDNLIKTFHEQNIPEEKDIPPIPVINRYVSQPLEPTQDDLTVKNFPIYNQPDKTKKRLNIVLPNKRSNLTLNEFPSFSNLSKKIKRNTKMLVPLEIPKFPVKNEESSEESDLSSEYSSECSSSQSSASSTPNISNENSYSNSISYSVSTKEKNILASIKPVK